MDLLADAETQLGARLDDSTIMRIRGTIAFGGGASPAQVKWGIKVISRSLFASGMSTTNSGPLTNPYEDWMWKRTYWVIAGFGTGFSSSTQLIDIDVRSRRKLRNLDDTLVLLGESAATSTASIVAYDLSVLLALP